MTTTPSKVSPVVVDAHVHVFSPDLVQRRASYLTRDRWFELLYSNPRAQLATAEALIEAMDVAGVERAVICGFPWADPALCHEHNEYMADAAARYPDRLSWQGIVVPTNEGGVREARWCFENRAVGIGELNADAQGFDWREVALLQPFAELCRGEGRPILLHASESVGHHYPGKGTATPEKLLTFLEHFHGLNVIAAHWGGGLPFFELMPEVAVTCANVSYDCAASTYLYKPRIFRSVLDIVGHERVLFGSDYPVLRMDRFLARVLQLEWRDAVERTAVLGGNARRIFGLDQDEGHRP